MKGSLRSPSWHTRPNTPQPSMAPSAMLWHQHPSQVNCWPHLQRGESQGGLEAMPHAMDLCTALPTSCLCAGGHAFLPLIAQRQAKVRLQHTGSAKTAARAGTASCTPVCSLHTLRPWHWFLHSHRPGALSSCPQEACNTRRSSSCHHPSLFCLRRAGQPHNSPQQEDLPAGPSKLQGGASRGSPGRGRGRRHHDGQAWLALPGHYQAPA